MRQAGERLAALGEARLRRWGPWVLALLALALLLPANNILPLIDRDEPRFAQATREMIERDDWVVPYFNGDYRFDKPIGIYWMMRGCYALFGINEFAARLPSVLSALALVLLTYYIGARWFSTVTGLVAGFGLLTCVQMQIHGRSAVADMPMVVCVLAGQLALFELLSDSSTRQPWRWWWLFWGAVGVGFLVKGPVSLVVPLVTLLLYRFAFWRQPLPWRRLRVELGLPVALAIMGSWGIPALVRTHGEFFQVGIQRHVIERGYSSFEGHGHFAPYFYFVAAFFSLFPWIAFGGDGVQAVRHRWNSKNAFLLAWAAGTYLLFTFYMTKLPHYVLPAFPALFLMLGQAAEDSATPARWTKIWFWFVTGVWAVAAAAALVFAANLTITPTYNILKSALFGAGFVACWLVCLSWNWRWGRWAICILTLVPLVYSMLMLGRSLRAMTPAIPISEISRQLPANTRLGCLRYAEPSLVFYTGRQWDMLHSTNDLAAFIAQPGPCLLVWQENEFRLRDYLHHTPRPDVTAPLAVLDTREFHRLDLQGFNTARASWVVLRVYTRGTE